MYELYEMFGQRIPLGEEWPEREPEVFEAWPELEPGVFELPQGGRQISSERIVEEIQPWLEKYWVTADLYGYEMDEFHIVNGTILTKASFPDHILPDRYYSRESLEEYREELQRLVAEVDAQLAKTDSVSEPKTDVASIPPLPVKSDAELIEKMGDYPYSLYLQR